MKAWSFFKTKFLADAPADIVDAFEAGGLRLPKDEDDFMCVVFGAIEALSPARLLSPDILTEKDDDETRLARAVLLCVLSHPRWWQAQALEGLATNDRMVAFRQKKPEDWKLWTILLFEITTLLVQRVFADVKTAVEEERSPHKNVVNLFLERSTRKEAKALLPEDIVATDDELLDSATEKYREALFRWNNDDDPPPFSKHDLWMALSSDPEDDIPSPSILVELRANRVMESYGLSRRDARLVVAVAEHLGKVISLDDEADDE
jgi:hypothetical protein